ncbi:hypothetical protein ABMA28_011100 [Loxostege sticticalis]|uniref:Uncharacterized protein n=1 Tax=Loxostege sticticalis TaxID=481309 RepID=A0ABD0S6R2_LOXSC
MVFQTIFYLCANFHPYPFSTGASSGSSAFGLGNANSIFSLGKTSPSLGLGKASNLGLSKTNSGIGGLRNVGIPGLLKFNLISSGPLTLTSISPIGPSGLAVASENAIKGNLGVIGQLPYLGALGLEGRLPAAGSGLATCGCGDGNIGVVNEGSGRPRIFY